MPLYTFISSLTPMQVLKEKVLWTFHFSSFPNFEWECLVIDAPEADDTILGYDFLSYWNPEIDWNQGLINLRTSYSTKPNATASMELLELNSQPTPFASSGIPPLPSDLQALDSSFPTSVGKPMETANFFETLKLTLGA